MSCLRINYIIKNKIRIIATIKSIISFGYKNEFWQDFLSDHDVSFISNLCSGQTILKNEGR